MTDVDVVVVGAGPAGSSCAAALVAAGLDVVILDQARFPRDKVCAGWITPDVVGRLQLDLIGYAVGRVLEPLTAFRLSVGGRRPTRVDYGRPVSYGVRRVEFDDYLVRQSGARLVEDAAVSSLAREAGRWVVNGDWRARCLVGAGGHRCPVARHLNPGLAHETVVVAQRAEPRLAVRDLEPGTAEIVFAHDLRGYAWLVPKGAWVNIGLGREDSVGLPAHVREFVRTLQVAGRLPDGDPPSFQGHAYLLASASTRRAVGDGAVLAGDAAGLAAPGSGEGILGAVQSGQLAAEAIRRLIRDRDALALARYAEALQRQLGAGRPVRPAFAALPLSWRTAAVATALGSRAVARHVLDRTFLHQARP